VAVGALALAGAAGLVVDEGLLYKANNQLQAAVDSAALAGSLELPYDPELSQGQVRQAVETALRQNYAEASVKSLTLGTEVRSVCVEGKATVDLTFAQVLGVADKEITCTACAGYNNLEIVMVIDNTGSMSGTPITKVRQAAVNMVNLVMPASGAASTKIGLVPFRGKVRVPAGVDGKAAGCRNADGTVNTTNSASCTSIPYIKALTTDKAAITTAINSMTATGTASGTVISEGIKWGRNVLTPEAPYTEGGDPKKYRKVMILLTDGDTEDGKCGGTYGDTSDPNNYWYNAYYGMNVKTCHCEDGGCLNAAMLAEAQLAKDAGIEIFSIRFGTSDATDVNLMKAVASSKPGTTDHYYDAPSSSDIDDMFKKIGRQLGLRLIK